MALWWKILRTEVCLHSLGIWSMTVGAQALLCTELTRSWCSFKAWLLEKSDIVPFHGIAARETQASFPQTFPSVDNNPNRNQDN